MKRRRDSSKDGTARDGYNNIHTAFTMIVQLLYSNSNIGRVAKITSQVNFKAYDAKKNY
jgi:hypothetical protein